MKLFNRTPAEIEPLIDPNDTTVRLTRRPQDAQIEYLLAEIATRIPDRQKARRLGRDYGRASHTIHGLRAENALLRSERDAWRESHGEGEQAIAELTQALDTRRPAADPETLGRLLREAWRLRADIRLDHAVRWEAVAETAIDYVRGLWPLDPRDVAVLDAEADRRLGPHTSPGATETVRSPAASWAGEPPAPGDTTLAQRASTVLEDLAIALGRRAVPDCTWNTLPDEFQNIYRAYVDVVINEGWRPPLTALIPATRRPVVAQVLVDHELLADDTCRCGKWAGIAWDVDIPKPSMWHAEHVAEQLLGLGVLA